MDFKSSFDINEEQLYMFEFLVDQINLTNESKKLIGKSPICVRLKFLDCPTITLIPEEPVHIKKKKQPQKLKEDKSKSTSVDFNMGKSCLFSKKPFDLIQEIRSKYLKVGIYTIDVKIPCEVNKEEEEEEKEKEEEIPICEAQVLLSGCLCDQVIMSMNDKNYLPKPYVLKNTYNLANDQGDPFGTITLYLRLSCCGKTIETQFALQEKSFLLKNAKSSNEFQCFNLPDDSVKKGETSHEKIGNFLEVTSAEKIKETDKEKKIEERNSGKTEEIISKNEVIENNSRKESESGSKEIKELFKTQSKTFNEEDGVNCSKSLTKLQFCQGGLCLGTKLLNDRTSRNLCHREPCPKTPISRLRGGGCCANARDKQPQRITYNPMTTNSSFKKTPRGKLSMDTLAFGACKSIWKNGITPNKTGCGCFGNGKLNSEGKCSKMPCTGVECFIRAFKETQDFVNSLGNVPGLAGLGLMDPSESPFFGRQEDDADTCQPKMNKSFDCIQTDPKASATLLKKGSRTQDKRLSETKYKDLIESPLTYTGGQILPFGVNRIHSDEAKINKQISRRLKKVDNAKGKFPNVSLRTNQDLKQVETGPCGDSECKSRRKKVDNTEESSLNNELKNNKVLTESPNENKSKTSIKNSQKDHKIKKRKKGSVQKKNSETSNSPLIKVSKKLMRQIRSLQERNPGIVYGHKNCLDLRLRVPKNMGWLWNSRNVSGRPPPKIGWKPGAISKYVYNLLKEAKAKSEEQEEEDKPPTPVKVKKINTPGLTNFQTFGRNRRVKKEESNQEIELPPTLHIHRKNGTYYITMYPIKSQNIANPEIQQSVKPLQFKVTKDKEDVDSSSSSISDMEIEFSPPTAISRYQVKTETKDFGTQLKQQDIVDAYKTPSLKTIKIKK